MSVEVKPISPTKWIILYAFAATADALQILVDLTGVGIAVSEAAEPFIGGGIIAICELFGIKILTNIKRLGSLVGMGLADSITGGAAPFWVVDIYLIQRDVKREETRVQSERSQQEILQNVTRQPLYEDGVRSPSQPQTISGAPSNIDGIRRPNS